MKTSTKKLLARLSFWGIGIASTIWFLVRVIPKPSRAAYPCMRAAAPIMSSFVLYLIALSGSAMLFKQVRRQLQQSKIIAATGLVVALIAVFGFYSARQAQPALAYTQLSVDANTPIGTPKGINPGRVTWYLDKDATNQSLDPSKASDMYILPKNTNQTVVQNMVDATIRILASEVELSDAWNKLFVYFNENHGKGAIGYQTGEKIFIKVNLVGQWGINSDFEISTGNYKAGHTTPQVMLAVIKHLVDEAGVPQANISIGDPIQPMPKEYFEYLSDEYPNVEYICSRGGNGHTKAEKDTKASIFYSDKGDVLREGDPNSWVNSQMGDPVSFDTLYKCIVEADYMINIANLKAHERAGVSTCAKNHFGSHTRMYAKQLHMGLVQPNQAPDEYSRDNYKLYRVLVDLMGHKKLGGNTMLFMIDGLYSAPGAGDMVVKWKSTDFGNDWTSSIFASQDHVAIEAVALDFMKEEYRSAYQGETNPQYNAVEDYLLQAADPSYWPDGFTYDPENDGSPLTSMGVYESWNNATEKKYSRNLSAEGTGIELIKVHEKSAIYTPDFDAISDAVIYPNPATVSSKLKFNIDNPSTVSIQVYNSVGQLMASRGYGLMSAGEVSLNLGDDLLDDLSAGHYICHLVLDENGSMRQKGISVVID